MRINFKDWTYNEPSSLAELKELERVTGLILPPKFIQFMLNSDGANGWVDDRYYVIYSVRQIHELILIYKNMNHYTEVMVFGGDGASEMYCFDKQDVSHKIILLRTSGSLEDAINVGHDLDDVFAFDLQKSI
jgi:hypothetical protein